jgi:hypothetical protein
LFVALGSFVLVLHWIQCSSCQQLASGYRLGGQRPTDNITVLVSDNRKDDEASIMGPFVPYQESRPAPNHHQQWNQKAKLFQEEEKRVRRDDSSSSSSSNNNKRRPAVDKDNSRLLVQTLNGLVRGTTKSALGDTVDVFLGVRIHIPTISNLTLFLMNE